MLRIRTGGWRRLGGRRSRWWGRADGARHITGASHAGTVNRAGGWVNALAKDRAPVKCASI